MNKKLNSIAINRASFFRKQYKRDKRNLSQDNPYLTEVSLRLMDYIEDNPDMSRARVAEMLNISQAYLSKIINGKANLSLKVINKYEKALGIPLLYRTQEDNTQKDFSIVPLYYSDFKKNNIFKYTYIGKQNDTEDNNGKDKFQFRLCSY